ncbi:MULTISPECIES: hypothetical protein [unclassified Leptolyngbya]|uniref:hypothetical protein n=1 Tax=unclassified Leptolyngbya TaxID=2650499 RepID=UPI00168754EB|nr:MULTISPECIES: hypothetical protein [unclassified Leptolyngbya]MBD1909114.1 hypothetical protein [Leptolyngbya sp. FACHB-8]MBD2157487.1 hypothetical protein [Leptolyngbya sp. FACHB-16]
MVKKEGFLSQQMMRFSTAVILLSMAEVGWVLLTPVRAQERRPGEAINSVVPLGTTLPQAYWDAIEDARTPEPNEVFRNLTAITPYNNTLVRDDQDRVLVTTWTTWNGYTQNIGNRLILTRDLWVTVVPDLQNFCENYTPTAEIPLAARLNQLLGLPPETSDRLASRQVVEIWVDPQFLFRPSPDPEITDHEAELGFRSANEFLSVSSAYQQWFYAQYDQRYQSNGQPITRTSVEASGTLPYPWTQLGYTYDWGSSSDWATVEPNHPENVGLSEFVIRQWSPISVKATRSVDDYCR